MFRVFLFFLGFLLLGYAYFGRGFAYLGYPPVYVDALLVALSLLILLLRPGWFLLLRDPLLLLLFAFMLWGAIRTLPYFPIYGLEAARDAVLWAYGIIALALAYLVRRLPLEGRALAWYATWMRWLPLWFLLSFALTGFLGEGLPRLPWGPGGGVLLFQLKPGDVAVHLAGLAGFWLLLSPFVSRNRVTFASWASWVVAAAIVVTLNRGGLLALFLALLIYALNTNIVYWRRLLALALLGVAAFVYLWVSGLEIPTGGHRVISARQIIENVASIFVEETENYGGTQSTKTWRLDWWSHIVAYTFGGPYFWTGKGFGINLADDDGFQVYEDGSLRSPHNGHLTVLARMGVPGFLLWVSLLLGIALRLWLSYWRLRFRGDRLGANISLWLMGYFLAMCVNASFDVYLEGPMGGIWFWSLVGFAVGFLMREKHAHTQTSHLLPAAGR